MKRGEKFIVGAKVSETLRRRIEREARERRVFISDVVRDALYNYFLVRDEVNALNDNVRGAE